MFMASLMMLDYGAMTTQKEKTGVKTSLRLSDSLHKWLEVRAKNNARSLNTEILFRLEASKLREEIEETMRAAGTSLATEPAATSSK